MAEALINPKEKCVAILKKMNKIPEVALWTQMWDLTMDNNLSTNYAIQGAELIGAFLKTSLPALREHIGKEISKLSLPQAVYLTTQFDDIPDWWPHQSDEQLDLSNLHFTTNITGIHVRGRQYEEEIILLLLDHDVMMDRAREALLEAYEHSGIPCKNFRKVVAFFILADLFKSDEEGVPKVFNRFVDIEWAVEREVRKSTKRSIKAVNLFVGDEDLQTKVRKMIEKKGEIMRKALLSMRATTNETHRTKAQCLVEIGRYYMDCIMNPDPLTGSASRKIVKEGKGMIELAVEERIANGDIDKEDERFKLIEVHAIGIHLPGYHENYRRDWRLCHYVFSTKTTKSFLQIIDPTLLDFYHPISSKIDLNEVCKDDVDTKRFCKLIEKIFMVNKLKQINHQLPMSHLPPSELYTITSKEGIDVKCPRILFEVFSNGFDAARRRQTSNQSEFIMEFPAQVIRAAIITMYEIRNFELFPIDMKIDILHLFNVCLFTQLTDHVVRQTITTTRHRHDLSRILYFHYTPAIEQFLVSTRPDIVLSWGLKALPVDQTLKEIIRLVELVRSSESANKLLDTKELDAKWIVHQHQVVWHRSF